MGRPQFVGECSVTPAEIMRVLKLRLSPKEDDAGNCLHVRAHYQDFGRVGGQACPDCHDIDFGNGWTKRGAA